jgi:hypothetical protein
MQMRFRKILLLAIVLFSADAGMILHGKAYTRAKRHLMKNETI